MITVKGIAAQSEVTSDTVRHYVKLELLKPVRNPFNGYREFSITDVKRIRFIRRAKLLGFSLSEIKRILKDSARGESPCPFVRDIMQLRIAEHKRKLNEMLTLDKRMKDALKKWQAMPDGVTDGASICHLIESFSE